MRTIKVDINDTASIPIPENKIKQQLNRVNFTPQDAETATNATTFTKQRTQRKLTTGTLSESTEEQRFLTVIVEEDELQIKTEEIIGVTQLTPQTQIQIEPDGCDWDDVIHMLLTVMNADRSVEYHGLNIEDFLQRDDLSITKIYPILSINFLNALQPVFRHGLIRRIEHRRDELKEPRGSIDIEKTLTTPQSIPATHHCRYNEKNYNIPVNQLLHFAGTTLLQLYHSDQHEGLTAHESETELVKPVFSKLQHRITQLEQHGITSHPDNVDTYRGVTTADVPAQREYYYRAIDIAQTILATTFNIQTTSNDLVVDYLIDLEDLFEEFTQSVLEQTLDEFRTVYDPCDYLSNVHIEHEPTINTFSNTSRLNNEPDHVLYHDDNAYAILDSKYYTSSHSPLIKSNRHQLLAYAYLLDPKYLGFVAPTTEHAETTTYHLENETGKADTIELIATDQFNSKQLQRKLERKLATILQALIQETIDSTTPDYSEAYTLYLEYDRNEYLLDDPDFKTALKNTTNIDPTINEFIVNLRGYLDNKNIQCDEARVEYETRKVIDNVGQSKYTRVFPTIDQNNNLRITVFESRFHIGNTNPAESITIHDAKTISIGTSKMKVNNTVSLDSLPLNRPDPVLITFDSNPSVIDSRFWNATQLPNNIHEKNPEYVFFVSSTEKITHTAKIDKVTGTIHGPTLVLEPGSLYQLESSIPRTPQLQNSTIMTFGELIDLDNKVDSSKYEFWKKCEDIGVRKENGEIVFDDSIDSLAKTLEKVVGIAIEEGHFTEQDVPYSTGRTRYLVNDEKRHKNGREMNNPHNVKRKYWVECNRSKDNIKNSIDQFIQDFVEE